MESASVLVVTRLSVTLHLCFYFADIKWKLCLVYHHVVEFALEQFLSGGGSGAKSNFKELISAPSLHVLFVQQVKQQVFVALNQSLRVDLSVL